MPTRIVAVAPFKKPVTPHHGFTHEEAVVKIAKRTAEKLELKGLSFSHDDIECSTDFVGSGYGDLTVASMEAQTLLAETEGLLLDPIYTSKAMAALISRLRGDTEGLIGKNIVFLHTGGLPALYAPSYNGKLWHGKIKITDNSGGFVQSHIFESEEWCPPLPKTPPP